MPRRDCTPTVPFVKNEEWQVRNPVSRVHAALNDLPPRAFALLTAIETFARNNNICWASNATLGEILGIEVRNVQTALAILVEKGYIRRQEDSKGRPFIFLRMRISSVQKPHS
jgi:DNA-binding MarR family transcriptional regulator